MANILHICTGPVQQKIQCIRGNQLIFLLEQSHDPLLQGILILYITDCRITIRRHCFKELASLIYLFFNKYHISSFRNMFEEINHFLISRLHPATVFNYNHSSLCKERHSPCHIYNFIRIDVFSGIDAAVHSIIRRHQCAFQFITILLTQICFFSIQQVYMDKCSLFDILYDSLHRFTMPPVKVSLFLPAILSYHSYSSFAIYLRFSF